MKILRYGIVLAAMILQANISYSQGCVAARGMATCSGSGIGTTLNLQKGEVNLLAGYRYFESFRHFRGDHEEPQRVEQGTQVINWSTFVDISANYGITDRIYANAVIPFMIHNRSSMYEHGGNPPSGLGQRHSTSSAGLSDIRLGVGYWLFEPLEHEFNYAIGVGVKLPTGNYDCTDLFYNQGAGKNVDSILPVDQSIQLGDGGVGITIDLQGYHPITDNIGISSSFFYMANPRETNGVNTTRKDVNGNILQYSCADQYGGRVGAFYNTSTGFSAYVGGRIEGVPAYDLIGGSKGFRRPGYSVAVEPGVSFSDHGMSVFLSMPWALYRNRVQSFDDIEKTNATGVFTNGDAAFADYLINLGFSWRFGGSHSM